MGPHRIDELLPRNFHRASSRQTGWGARGACGIRPFRRAAAPMGDDHQTVSRTPPASGVLIILRAMPALAMSPHVPLCRRTPNGGGARGRDVRAAESLSGRFEGLAAQVRPESVQSSRDVMQAPTTSPSQNGRADPQRHVLGATDGGGGAASGRRLAAVGADGAISGWDTWQGPTPHHTTPHLPWLDSLPPAARLSILQTDMGSRHTPGRPLNRTA